MFSVVLRFVASFCILVGWVLPSYGSIDAPASAEIGIVRAEFGIYTPTESGELLFTPSHVVPLIEGQKYGWSILLRTSKPIVKWREEFTLPSAPATWNGDLSDTTISKDRTTSVVEKEVMPANGMIGNVWSVAPGDPAGHYIIKVTIDGKLQQTFEFDVLK